MSDFKRWTNPQSDATDAEREVLAAGSAQRLALGEGRKAELRRALAIAIGLPLPPDGGTGDGQGGGPAPPAPPPPPPAAPPVTPPPAAEAGGALGSVGKLIFSGKASGALAAFALAAGTTAGVLGVATLIQERAPAAPAASFVKHIDQQAAPRPPTPPASSETPTTALGPTVAIPDLAAPTVPRPARSPGEKATLAVDLPTPPAPLTPPEAAPPAATVSALAAPVGPTTRQGAVLVIPSAPDARLADEIARVRMARDALRSGNAPQTLSLLDALDREHPAGTLGQEREALRIEALANSGRTSDARSRADAFLARHPGSAFATSVGRFATR